MDLSPNNIRTYEFTTQMRGYSKDDVDSFLDEVADALEKVKQENLKLSMEIDSLKTQLTGLREFEDTIKSAAIDARRNADLTIANAKEEAESILSETRTEAEKLIESRARRIREIEAQLAKAEMHKVSYFSKLQNLITSHLEIINDIDNSETDIKPTEPENIEVTESSEVDNHQMKTIASDSSPSEHAETEEADEVENIVPMTTETESTEETENDTPDEGPKQIDPELADALDNYQRKDTDLPEKETSAPNNSAPVQSPAMIIETTQRAEDIPPGFIVKSDDVSNEEQTGKIPISDTENAIHNTDEYNTTSPVKQIEPVNPENLAVELDKVVAKFEEEMDKAAKA